MRLISRIKSDSLVLQSEPLNIRVNNSRLRPIYNQMVNIWRFKFHNRCHFHLLLLPNLLHPHSRHYLFLFYLLLILYAIIVFLLLPHHASFFLSYPIRNLSFLLHRRFLHLCLSLYVVCLSIYLSVVSLYLYLFLARH
jgi:hypothetical protein